MDPNVLALRVFDTSEEAIAAGYSYVDRTPIPTYLDIKEAVVVRQGTVAGRPTVDFILKDADGNEFVTVITGNLLEMIPTSNT